jgi:hypothetical protein
MDGILDRDDHEGRTHAEDREEIEEESGQDHRCAPPLPCGERAGVRGTHELVRETHESARGTSSLTRAFGATSPQRGEVKCTLAPIS